MIGYLRGRLVSKMAPFLVLDVHGVGYELQAPMSTFYDLPAVGEEVRLLTHLLIREDAHTLYGFGRDAERTLFRSLLRVNGVGAKLALTILSGLPAEEFHRCVQQHDSAALVRLPGVGKKTAERLIVEMHDRLPDLPLAVQPGDPAAGCPVGTSGVLAEAVNALVALGFREAEAHRMVGAVSADVSSSEEIIRRALQSVGR